MTSPLFFLLGHDRLHRQPYTPGTSAASQQQWGLSTDKKATFYPRNSFQLIEELTRVDKFVAQVTPYNESPVTALFDVSGLADAAGPFFETCKSK
jgi:type VI secretion system protein VasI